MSKQKSEATFTLTWTENGWLIRDDIQGRNYVCETQEEDGIFAVKGLPSVLENILKDRREMYE